ncbi:Asp-tRNA(Asn)/Glu-tRNA(Gln) amidotransferase subunit GatC [Caviibacter abscessus]|uniref:Asp-tRNA(Asn)/Glu-tRNA(Gln) amidotransferase subunit GatC n=1 Tax=Caviibacter abscessus TaxID=1766719 RepID=UPI000830CAE9|nr:Asp-tRNA(Asn)/Glu-tRNA(Gln) amidotransferase subunit GatC [Caviibacter abscessus]
MFDREEVIKIAKLSKLEFDEKELLDFQSTLNSIFDYMETLNEVDVEGVEPLYNVLDIQDRTREDVVFNATKKEDFFKNANQKDENFIIVPKIVASE